MKRSRSPIWSAIAPFLIFVFIAGCAERPTWTPKLPTATPISVSDGSAFPPEGQSLPFSEGEISGEISMDRNFYAIIDGSGSMNDPSCSGQFTNRIAAAKWAVGEFVSQSVPPDVNFGLYVFDDRGATERAPLERVNRNLISDEIDQISGGGKTPLNDAIRQGVNVLAIQRQRQLGYGEFYIIVATDGEASDGDLARIGVPYALRYAIPIITIGFCLDQEHPLAADSISYRSALNPQELLGALQETQGESTYFEPASFDK